MADPADKPDLLDNAPFGEVAPSSLPLATFVRLPQDTNFDLDLYTQTGLSARLDIHTVRTLEQHRSAIQQSISSFYSRRTITFALDAHLKRTPANAAVLDKIAAQEIKPLHKLVSTAHQMANSGIEQLVSLLSHAKIWENGTYSAELFQSTCGLLFDLFVLDQVHYAKKAISLDIKALSAMMSPANARTIALSAPIATWLDQENAVFSALAKGLSGDIFVASATSLYRYIKGTVSSDHTIVRGQKYTLIISLYMLLELCPACFPPADIPFLKKLVEATPNVPLYHEFYFNLIGAAPRMKILTSAVATFTAVQMDPA
jgi:hypothetical protein